MTSLTKTVQPVRRAIARPLKVLIPLIKSKLVAADDAALEHYRDVGKMLIEAREQVAYFKWNQWLSKNFELSKRTAERYMKLARVDFNEISEQNQQAENSAALRRSLSLADAIGEKRSNNFAGVHKAIGQINVERFAEERRVREDEIKTHREMALELIDLGYRAMATRLHPDRRGGSQEAMTRLNAIRDELKSVAATRRFI